MVEVYPDRAYGYHNLGCYYMDKRKDFDTAASYFAKALQLDPAFPRLRTQIGYLMLQRGDYPAALQQYAEALAQNPYDAEAYLNSGFALERLQRFEEALSAYRNFLKLPAAELAGSRPVVEAKVQMLSQMLGVGISTRTIP
jgi:tetratricopeptide (TPR) repeat protein